MRILKEDFQRGATGSVTLMPEGSEDMWAAYNLIRTGDHLHASAVRRVRIETNSKGSDDVRGGSAPTTRVHTYFCINVKSTFFDVQGASLHVNGTIVGESQFAAAGQHHTLDLELHRAFTLTKFGGKDSTDGRGVGWDSVSVDMIRQACKPGKGATAWAVIMQEGVANVAMLTGERTVYKQKVSVQVSGKKAGEKAHSKSMETFFRTTLDTLLRHLNLPAVPTASTTVLPVLLASPGFTAVAFQKFISDTATETSSAKLRALLKSLLVIHSSSGHVSALAEVLATPVVMAQLKDTQFARETALMDRFMTLLRSDDGRAWYGPKQVEEAVDRGAVGKGGGVLMISNELFRSQDPAIRARWVKLVDSAKDMHGGEVRIMSSAHESGQRLGALGGVAAILTFPLEELLNEEGEEGGEGEGLEGNIVTL